MTPEAQLALIAAIVPTLAAIGAIIVTILSHLHAVKKLDHITVLSNSTLTKANKRVDELEHTIRELLVNGEKGDEVIIEDLTKRQS